MASSTSTKKNDVPAEAAGETETPAVELEDTREGKVTAKERKHSERFPCLTDDEADLVRSLARPAVAPCICGCGGTTKGRFVPGHDAVLKERLKNTPDSDGIMARLGW